MSHSGKYRAWIKNTKGKEGGLTVAFSYISDINFNMRHLSKDDRRFFMQNFGCARKVYNLCVDFLYHKLEGLSYTGGDVLPQIRFPEVSSFIPRN